MLRLEKVQCGKIGIYVTVTREIVKRSFAVLPVVFLLFFAFLFALRFRLNDRFYSSPFPIQSTKAPENNTNATNSTIIQILSTDRVEIASKNDDDKIIFNSTISFSIVRLLTMILGELETKNMGLDTDVSVENFTNYIVYFAFLCMVPILIS